MPEGNSETGFSLELRDLVAADHGNTYKIVRVASFSGLLEPINRSLLFIHKDGTYEQIYRKWFGSNANF